MEVSQLKICLIHDSKFPKSISKLTQTHPKIFLQLESLATLNLKLRIAKDHNLHTDLLTAIQYPITKLNPRSDNLLGLSNLTLASWFSEGVAANQSGGTEKNFLSLERTTEEYFQRNEQRKSLLGKLQGIASRDTILVISCVIAVSVDPLFFYLPVIVEETKCLGMDKSLSAAALCLRGFTDIAFILNIFYRIKDLADKVQRLRRLSNRSRQVNLKKFEKIRFAIKLAWMSILIDFVAVLPIPQVLIVAIFVKIRSFAYMNPFLLAQQFLRFHRMHHFSVKIRQRNELWIKAAFYFFLYILAGHVLGALWYFFSIQREVSCWQQVCKIYSTKECNFSCNDDITSRNMTFIRSLDEYCLADVPTNATVPFDYGIFLDSLKSGNTGKINFAKKYCYSFWWGLRNLSNFGTNLETSRYVWENCFAILISMIGLLLFLYLIGNLQLIAAAISIKIETSLKTRRKMNSKLIPVQLWMERNGLSKDTREEIIEILKHRWEEIRDADIMNLFSILPRETRIFLTRSLCMKLVNKVPIQLKTMRHTSDQEKRTLREKVSITICTLLRPVIYPDNSFLFRMGEPLDRVLFITEGLIWMYNPTSSSSHHTSQGDAGTSQTTYLERGSFYGDELLSWASDSLTSLANLPMLNVNVKSHGKVEGFVLMAKDLKVVVNKYKMYWVFSDPDAREKAAFCTIQEAIRQFRKQTQRPRILDFLPKKITDFLPTSPSIALDVRSEDTTTASSQVP